MPELTYELRALGRTSAPATDVDAFAARVLAALPAAGVRPVRAPVRRRVALALLALVVVLVATPPVRATVAEWLGFGVVRVERGDEPSGRAEVPALTGGPPVAEAAAQATFPLLVPEVLGEPDGVEVAVGGDRVSMTWGRGEDTVRLDQLAGSPDFAVVKQAPRLRFATVGGREVLWLPSAHRLAMLDQSGEPSGEFRTADRTMLVLADGSTLRLEGADSFDEAAEWAGSLRPVE